MIIFHNKNIENLMMIADFNYYKYNMLIDITVK